jgi:hypothetical protein
MPMRNAGPTSPAEAALTTATHKTNAAIRDIPTASVQQYRRCKGDSGFLFLVIDLLFPRSGKVGKSRQEKPHQEPMRAETLGEVTLVVKYGGNDRDVKNGRTSGC